MKKNLLKLALIGLVVFLAVSKCHAQKEHVTVESAIPDLGSVFFDPSGHDFIIRYNDGTWHSSLHDSLSAIKAVFAADSLEIIKSAGYKKMILSLDKISNYLFDYINTPKANDSASKVKLRIELRSKIQTELDHYYFLLKVYPLNE